MPKCIGVMAIIRCGKYCPILIISTFLSVAYFVPSLNNLGLLYYYYYYYFESLMHSKVFSF